MNTHQTLQEYLEKKANEHYLYCLKGKNEFLNPLNAKLMDARFNTPLDKELKRITKKGFEKDGNFYFEVNALELYQLCDDLMGLGFYKCLEFYESLTPKKEIVIDEIAKKKSEKNEVFKNEIKLALERYKQFDYGELTIFEESYNEYILSNITPSSNKPYLILGGRYHSCEGNLVIYQVLGDFRDPQSVYIRIALENEMFEM